MKVKEYRIFTFYWILRRWGQNLEIYFDEDTQLMIKAAEGDNNAYAVLYKKYLPIITRYAAKRNGHNRSSEDIAQEVLTRVYENRASYRPTAAFKTYLFTYAKNVIHKYQHRFTEQVDSHAFTGVAL